MNFAAFGLLFVALAGAASRPADVPEPAPLVADEPFAATFSLALAAESLDRTALHWQRTRSCAACHTLPLYLMARPSLAKVVAEPPQVRRFFEQIVEQNLEGEPALPKDAVAAVVIEVAAALAFHDRATTAELHHTTRKELDRMWTLQRADGAWEWPYRDTPPMKSDEHFGVTMAALAAGVAPGGYLQTEAARHGLARIREYLEAHPPTCLHQKGMLLWVSASVEEILTPAEREQFRSELAAAQRPDGGWSTASLVENPGDPERQTEPGRTARAQPGHGEEFLVYVGRENVYRSSLASDGYATGFVLYVLRQSGMPAEDARIRSGVDWLMTHQRASGRWFTPSQGWHTQNRIANAGTAFAVLALDACGRP